MNLKLDVDTKKELSDFNFRLECGAAMVDAVRELLARGEYSNEDYEKALFGSYLYIRSLCDELSDMIR